MNIYSEKSVVKTYNKLHKLPLGSVIAKGWLKEQLTRSKHGTGGHLDELEPDMIANPFINYSCFKRLPGRTEDAKPTFAAGWSGEISGTYWTGLVQLAYTLNDEELIAKATRWIEGVLKHQEPDGYLGSYNPETTDRNADYNAWSAAWCYRAMLSYYEATGRQDVLEAVHKGLLWFCENWKEHKTDYVGSIIIEAMVIVYAYTGDERLIQFSQDWLDWLEDNSNWQNKVSQYLSDSLPYASMHVVAYGEDMKHPGILYCANGNETYKKASLNAVAKALHKIVQTTGGPSSCMEFLSPKGAINETEYCNFSTWSHSYSWLAMITGEASWGDEIERIIFNGSQGARKKDEKANAYMSAPNQLHAGEVSSHFCGQYDMGAYTPCHSTACCPTQMVRLIPEFIRGMCMLNEQGEPHLFCYGPAAIQAENFGFEMDTLYPFRENIQVKVTKAKNQVLHLRIPAWCKNPIVTVNGEAAGLAYEDNGFAALQTKLNTGDTVEIRFPMEIKITKVDDSASNSKFPISIERGPLVYALPVPEKWTPYAGRPMTPLPEGWTWYNADADHGSPKTGAVQFLGYKAAPWAKAINEHVCLSHIKVVEHDVEGYVWENPPISLEVPMYQAPYTYNSTGRRTQESWDCPVYVEGEEHLCRMVPHGCTNLRITYIPRARV